MPEETQFFDVTITNVGMRSFVNLGGRIERDTTQLIGLHVPDGIVTVFIRVDIRREATMDADGAVKYVHYEDSYYRKHYFYVKQRASFP